MTFDKHEYHSDLDQLSTEDVRIEVLEQQRILLNQGVDELIGEPGTTAMTKIRICGEIIRRRERKRRP